MFSKFSVKKPFTIVVSIIIVMILGGVSFINMSTNLLPSINLPYAVISTPYVGASPEQVEMMVTRPIEQRMSSVSNIKNINSISREHMSLIILEFTSSTNMDSAIIEMRENLDMIKSFIPDDVGNSMILKLNPDMMPVMVLAASVNGETISESSTYIENNIIPSLEGVDGIASVTTSGLLSNKIHVMLNDEKINEVNKNLETLLSESGMPKNQIPNINITKEIVEGILKGQNFSMPTGYITEDNMNYLIRVGDKINNIEELKNLPIIIVPIPGIEPILLNDIAEIIELDDSNDVYTKLNGEDAVILAIQKQSEYPTSEVAKNLRDRINDIMQDNDKVQIVSLMDQGEYIDLVVSSISRNLILGGILAVLILLFFLRDIRPTIVIGLAIPISIVTALVMMYFSGISLNIISMGGLALGVGMLVDNSIVVIENIYRMRKEGKSAKEAAILGANQVSGAILASTLTTISVFIPILFTQGFTRQIFSDMGLTIAYSLIASLIIALTLVPMVASNVLLKNAKEDSKTFNKIKEKYSKILHFSLKHRGVVVCITLGLFVISIIGAFNMGTELFPASDTGQITVDIVMPKGSTFNETTIMADNVMDIILEIDGIETVGATTSSGPMSFGPGSSDSVSLYVLLNDKKTKTTSQIAQIIRDKTNDLNAEINVSDASMDIMSLSGSAISINIEGQDFDVLSDISKDIAEIIKNIEGTIQVDDGSDKSASELRIIVDKEKSIKNNLTVAQVFMAVNNMLKTDNRTTTLLVGNKELDIYVKDELSEMKLNQEDLLNSLIETPQGEKITVRDIATIEESEGFKTITRQNQQRFITVSTEIAEGYNIAKVSNEIKEEINKFVTPEGYSINISGEIEMINDSLNDLFLMLILAILFIYLIMVAQFESLLSPFIVMFTIPLAFTGGLFGLMITGNPISIVAFVGLIILSGVVVNNGIVFVDYINILIKEGLSKKDAIIRSGNDRIRPIFMTALTTILALSTMAIGIGQGSEMIQPMAIAAIGGLIYATFLTLIFIPVIYDLFYRKVK